MPPTGCVTFSRLLNTSGLSFFIYKIRTMARLATS